jgi:hypothetical protein
MQAVMATAKVQLSAPGDPVVQLQLFLIDYLQLHVVKKY